MIGRSVVLLVLAAALVGGCAADQPRRIDPRAYGAVGDGTVDDGPAVQRAFDDLQPGDTVVLSEGSVFRHDDVLTLGVPGVTVSGPGTLLAGSEQRAAVIIAADDVSLHGPTIAIEATSRRWTGADQMAVRVSNVAGTAIADVRIDGSAAAGLMLAGAHDFSVNDLSVAGTRADGVHITGGSRDGSLDGVTVSRSGDDGIAVVSYRNDSAPVRDISVSNSQVLDQVWGRGFSVVGGEHIDFRDIEAVRTAGAGLYVASEEEFDTLGVRDVLVEGARLTQANGQGRLAPQERPSPDQDRVVHGAVMIYDSQPDQAVADVTMRHLQLNGTQGEEQVRLVATSTGTISGVTLEAVTISGGAPRPLVTSGVPTSAWSTSDWTVDGSAVPDPSAFTAPPAAR